MYCNLGIRTGATLELLRECISIGIAHCILFQKGNTFTWYCKMMHAVDSVAVQLITFEVQLSPILLPLAFNWSYNANGMNLFFCGAVQFPNRNMSQSQKEI